MTAAVVDPERLTALHVSGVLGPRAEPTFQGLTRVASRLLDVPVALVSFVDEDRQLFRGCVGMPEPIATDRQTPLSHSFCQYVVAADEPLIVPDARDHPVLRRNLALRDLDVVAYLGVPLRDPDGEVLGSLCAIAHEPRAWTDTEVSLLQDVAEAAMTEIALLRAVVEEYEARTAALEANRRLRSLSEASAVLAESLDFQQTLDNVVRLLVPEHADWGVIDLLRDGQVMRVSLVASGPEREQAARRLIELYPPDVSDLHGVGTVLRSGAPAVIPIVDEAYIEQVARDPQHHRLLMELGVASAVIAPLRVGSGVVGALSLVSATPGRYDDGFVPFVTELASRIALAVESARLYDERDRVASTLQAALLPATLPQPPGFSAAARYHAARGGSEVGGDFYDLFDIGDGRWMAVVGDVRGKGVPAAALTGLVRHTIRGAALRDAQPVRVLQTLNRALLMETPVGAQEDPRFCTVVCALLRPDERGVEVDVVSAGHPPAVLIRSGDSRAGNGTAGNGVETLGGDGTLLGVLDDVDLRSCTARLGPGDTLLLHTDGVTDARADGDFFGDERLHRALRPPPAGAAEAADRVTGAAMAWQRGVARDDIAVLALTATAAG